MGNTCDKKKREEDNFEIFNKKFKRKKRSIIA
jgi:hypothetical protein